MDRKKLLKRALYLIFLIFLANFLANEFYWYFSVSYFDMIMHFLGGLFLGLMLIWFLSSKNSVLELSPGLIFKILVGVLFVGISWEIFELLFNNIVAQNPFNYLDTGSDIFFDLSGGLCAILYIWRKQPK
jgi:hypothetical protein